MSKFIHFQFFKKPTFQYEELNVKLSNLGYKLLQNGQTFLQYSQGAVHRNFASESWLLDISPAQEILNIDALHHLKGSFSGVNYHKTRNSVTLFRDSFGLKSLFYFYDETRLIVGNDLATIVHSLEQVPEPELRELHQYFDPRADSELIGVNTFFKNIFRVLPGQKLTFDSNGLHKTFIDVRVSALSSFAENLWEGIAPHLQHDKKIGSQLSGGLDSSSICSLLADNGHPLSSFYLETNTTEAKEIEFAYAVAIEKDFELNKVELAGNAFKNAVQIAKLSAQPDPMVIPSEIFLKIFQSARQKGIHQMFSGHGGDNVVDSGLIYLKQLFQSRNWPKLKRALSQRWRLADTDTDFESYYLDELMRIGGKSRPHWLIFAGISWSKLLQKLQNKWLKNPDKVKAYDIFVASQKIDKQPDQILEFLKKRVKEKELRLWQNSLSTLGIKSVETQEVLAKNLGLELIFPFFTKEMITFSAAQSDEFNFYDGLQRGVLREGMKGILPEKVRLRTKKAAFNQFGYQRFLDLWHYCQKDFLEEKPIWKYIHQPVFQKIIEKATDPNVSLKNKSYEVWLSNRILNLSIWLDVFYSD